LGGFPHAVSKVRKLQLLLIPVREQGNYNTSILQEHCSLQTNSISIKQRP
jgi:hypothetical protein